MTSQSHKEQCPCCGYFTLDERGGYDICKVCFWEDEDTSVYGQPALWPESGANGVGLEEARRNYLAFGVSEERFRESVRAPLPEELPENNQP